VAVSRIISLHAALLIIRVLIDCWSAFFMLMFSDSELALTLIDEGLMGLKFDSVEHVSSRRACVAFYYSVFQTLFSHTTITILVRAPVYRAKHVRIPVGTASINTYVQDNGLPGCFAAW
jgi:ammonia channel protein AmtB